MRGSSLATRLFLSATAWVVVILVLTGVVLSSVYRDATERAFDRRLNLYLRTLIAEVATPDEPPDRQFQSLGEPLFELPCPAGTGRSRGRIRARPRWAARTRPRCAARARCGTRPCRNSKSTTRS